MRSRLPSRASAIVAAALALSASAPGAQAGRGEAIARGVHVVGSGHLNRTVVVRAAPRGDARRVTVLREFRADYRPQVVLALSERRDPETGEAAWYRISVPGRPNGRTGWIPAGSADIKPARRLIYIDRSARRLEVWSRGRLALRTTVAVGRPGMETPLGLFYVTWRFVPTAPVLGRFAFETSAYSRLSDWPGGGIVGIHGTFEPWLLGQRVSHGCVRVANRDILRMRSLVGVGTPIRIVA
ncbi:MAG TPA: L,D-transpeptidase [Gaiellaceae bacterium]|nr:L,D-transpeptidase [Gaiellaceae bacterium]